MNSSAPRSWSVRYWPSVGCSSVVGLPAARAAGNRARNLCARFRFSWKLLALFIAMKFITVPLTILIFSALADSARAETAAPAEDTARIALKQVTGTVVTTSTRALSLEYTTKDGDVYEMLLPLGKDVKLERLGSLKELQPGDTILVKFKQRYLDVNDGDPRLLSTEVFGVALVKSKSEGLRSAQ